MLERRDVVGDFCYIVEGEPGNLPPLEQQQIRKGGLRPLDLAGAQRFPADVCVKDEIRLR
jgi:hypothetical protein